MRSYLYNILFILSLVLIFAGSFSYTIYQNRYLLHSFKIHSDSRAEKVKFIDFIPPAIDGVIDTNIYVDSTLLKNSGYTFTFDIKTEADNAKFFSTSNAKGGGSIFWNIHLIDGKLQTNRLENTEPVLINKAINDNKWHNIKVVFDREQKIYIDGTLESRMKTKNLNFSDKWFNFSLQPTEENPETIYLRNVLFINKPVDNNLINLLNKYFITKDFFLIVATVILGLIKNTFTYFLITVIAIYYIKFNYPNNTFSSILKKLAPVFFLVLVFTVFLWTDYKYKALFASIFFAMYIFKFQYKKILPNYISKMIINPLSLTKNLFMALKGKSKIKNYNIQALFFLIIYVVLLFIL